MFCGLDNLPTSVLKDTLPLIVKPLCHVLNLSLAQGKIPEAWKLARVSPIFKGGGRDRSTKLPTNIGSSGHV